MGKEVFFFNCVGYMGVFIWVCVHVCACAPVWLKLCLIVWEYKKEKIRFLLFILLITDNTK